MRWTPRRLKFALNWYPPYLGAGVRVDRVSDDWLELDVSMKLRWYNRNAVGTHFGGSLYTMVDPHFMLLLIGAIGKDYIVWDQAAQIRFRKPGKGRVHAKIRLTKADMQRIHEQTQGGQTYRPEFDLLVQDESGDTVAEVHKILYIKRKNPIRSD